MPVALIAVVVFIAIAAIGAATFSTPSEPAEEPIEVTTAREPEEESDAPSVESETVVDSKDETEDIEIDSTITATFGENSQPIPEPLDVPVFEDTEYDNGSYTAAAFYFTPARVRHDMDITLTITNDVVTNASVAYDGGPAKTSTLERFDGAYKAAVIGVPLDELSLSRVGGASLTSSAFNDAVVEIRQQAS